VKWLSKSQHDYGTIELKVRIVDAPLDNSQSRRITSPLEPILVLGHVYIYAQEETYRRYIGSFITANKFRGAAELQDNR
jgi:hypothetical protein